MATSLIAAEPKAEQSPSNDPSMSARAADAREKVIFDFGEQDALMGWQQVNLARLREQAAGNCPITVSPCIACWWRWIIPRCGCATPSIQP